MNWYYVEQGKQAGPVDDARLDQLRAEGKIQDETLIWHEGMANWQAYRQVKGFPPPPMAAPPLVSAAALAPAVGMNEAICAECRTVFPKENLMRFGNSWVCANCKPVFMQKMAEGISSEMQYAGFWIRFVAKFIDGLILAVVLVIPFVIIMVVFMAAAAKGSMTNLVGVDASMHAGEDAAAGLVANLFGLLFQFVFVVVNAVYAGVFVGKYGATPGKMACKLIVVDPAGGKISYGRAFGRGFAEILSRITCSIGYIIAAFDGEKRALHDHVCTTRVVYKESLGR